MFCSKWRFGLWGALATRRSPSPPPTPIGLLSWNHSSSLQAPFPFLPSLFPHPLTLFPRAASRILSRGLGLYQRQGDSFKAKFINLGEISNFPFLTQLPRLFSSLLSKLLLPSPHPGFPGDSDSEESTCQCRRSGFNPWVGKIPWRREWQPTPVFLPGEFHGLRRLAGYSPWAHKESDTTERVTLALTFLIHQAPHLLISLPQIPPSPPGVPAA